MKYIKRKDRLQTHLFPVSLEESIDPDNEVRLIDLFVDSLTISEFGFKTAFVENGRPAYHPADLLKLFIYGYMNKTRSSRDLEKSCKRNIEVMWLIGSLQPDHLPSRSILRFGKAGNTISNFRRDNPKAIRKVFRATVQLAKHFDLIGGKLIAGDSTKLRAQNSKKNNFNQKKIDRHIGYIDKKVEAYNRELATADGDTKKQIEEELKKYTERKENYQQLEQQLQESGETQVSASDPESRQLITRNNITEVAYNVQSTVDAKNKLLIDYQVTNSNDSKAMGNMLRRAKTILRNNEFTALYDKGYHTGSEFEKAGQMGIDVLVAIPAVASQAPDPAYNVERFSYNKEGDYYLCPQGNKLTTPGTWHKAKTYNFKRYTTKDCMQCRVKSLCTKAKYGKGVQRSEYTEYIEQNKTRIEKNKSYYRMRQAIVEHPYGTIKRQWGFSYILTKKFIKRAEADVGLMFTAYNLRRLISIIGSKEFTKHLKDIVFLYIAEICSTIRKYKLFKAFSFFRNIEVNISSSTRKGLIFAGNW